jgi:hypothetical protein
MGLAFSTNKGEDSAFRLLIFLFLQERPLLIITRSLEDNIKMHKNLVGYCGMHLFKAVQECVIGCREYGPEISGAVKCGELFCYPSSSQVLKEDSQFLFSGMLVLMTLPILFAVVRNFFIRVFCRGSFGNQRAENAMEETSIVE